MGAGAYLEPLAVITLLFGGAWINRARDNALTQRPVWWTAQSTALKDEGGFDAKHDFLAPSNLSLSPSLLPSQESAWRDREVRILSYCRTISTPNTAVLRGRLLSRLLHKFPFLVEAWYWALIYWVSLISRSALI